MGLRTWLGLKKSTRIAKHLLLTRYNLNFKIADEEGVRGLSDEYLIPRGELFRRYCVPSVQAQTRKDFEWMVLFHPDTPRVHYEFLDGIATVILGRTVAEASEIIVRRLPRGPILSTRLDNDDCIAPDLIALSRKTAKIGMKIHAGDLFVTPQFGAVASLPDGVWRKRRRPSPPFISLLWRPARGKPWKSPLHFDHTKHGGLPLVPISHPKPLWCAIVHDQNLRQRWELSPHDMSLDTIGRFFPTFADPALSPDSREATAI